MSLGVALFFVRTKFMVVLWLGQDSRFAGIFRRLDLADVPIAAPVVVSNWAPLKPECGSTYLISAHQNLTLML